MIVTGADSGIGCAVAIVFAKDGAEVSIVYLEEQEYAEEMRRSVGPRERRALLIAGDLGQEAFCRDVVDGAVKAFGRLDAVVNNAAEQYVA